MKKILVTGGAGFIGSNLCEALFLQGYEVWSLDNYSTGSISNHVTGVNYITGSTKNISDLVLFEPDIVFHLGEYSRVEQSFDDIIKVFDYNMSGTFEVLEFCKRKKCRLIYSGSSTKFGDSGEGQNQSPYGWTKSKNTELVKNYGDWFDLDFAIVYFYNAYGAREISSGKYSTLVAIFIEKMRKGEPLTVVLPGSQQRNFTHVEDIVNGLIIVSEKGKGDGYGIGNDKSYTIIELAEMFGGEIEYLPERKGNRLTAELVTEKTKKLGWYAKNNIEDYIKGLGFG